MSIGKAHNYVPIYMYIMSMDTYRQMWYTIAILEEVYQFLNGSSSEVKSNASQCSSKKGISKIPRET